MTNRTKRLLLIAVSVIALALALAPVSFAGEDDSSGPTQVGEIAGPITTPAPAEQIGPAPAAPTPAAPAPVAAAPVAAAPVASATSPSTSQSSTSTKKSSVKGVSKTVVKTISTKDTVKAKGGIQAGYGGMATQSTSLPMTLAFAGGILFILAGAAGFTPLRRRSQD
jgi:hypothetical protein